MKIAFMGSSQLSKIVLEKLYNSKHKIVCVVTSSDKSVGRGNKIQFSPVKQFALENNIPVLQYQSVSNEGYEDIKALQPDVLVTASFSHFLKDNILNLAPFGVLNVHPSLLPKYRGSSPVAWAVIKGETITGTTIMKTSSKMDAGNILMQQTLEVLPDETTGELSIRLFDLGGILLIETLKNIENGTITEIPQNEEESSYFPKLAKEMGKIDFNQTDKDIQNLCNGLNPWPLCYVQNFSTKEVLKVYKVKPFIETIENDSVYKIGQVVLADAKKGLVVKCKNGFVILEIIQASGGKVMPSKSYLNGKKIELGTQF